MQPIEIRRIPTLSIGAVLLALALLIPPVEARAASYELADDGSTQIVGEDTHLKTRYEDTLFDLARQYGVGSEEITRANPKVDPWLPGAGTAIVIPGRRILPPGPREGIIVNIAEHRLYYYPKRRVHGHHLVITYPVSIGKMDWKTPLGLTTVIQKIRNPTWYPPESVRVEHLKNGDPLPKLVRPGPDNPLGAYAMRLAVKPGDYLIHGTNNPLAVGMPVTHGCIRMYPEDVQALFPTVPVGTPVRLINVPLKDAFIDGQLWLEVHAPVDEQGQTIPPEVKDLEQMLNTALGSTTTAIDWDYAVQTLKLANGIPVTVGLQADIESSPQTQQTSAGGQPAAPAPDAGHDAPAETQTSTDAQPGASAPPAPAPAESAAPASAPATSAPPASASDVARRAAASESKPAAGAGHGSL
jgi:L,D-transpeptidase ErfK/SrfK